MHISSNASSKTNENEMNFSAFNFFHSKIFASSKFVSFSAKPFDFNDDLFCLQSAAHKVRNWMYMMQQTLSYLLGKTVAKVVITKTVDEWLFKGYEDMLITMGKVAVTDDDLPPFDKFGWFYLVCICDTFFTKKKMIN